MRYHFSALDKLEFGMTCGAVAFIFLLPPHDGVGWFLTGAWSLQWAVWFRDIKRKIAKKNRLLDGWLFAWNSRQTLTRIEAAAAKHGCPILQSEINDAHQLMRDVERSHVKKLVQAGWW